MHKGSNKVIREYVDNTKLIRRNSNGLKSTYNNFLFGLYGHTLAS